MCLCVGVAFGYEVTAPSVPATVGKPKNIILMIPDGMGINHYSAAWIANMGKLNMDKMPVAGMARTQCADYLVTDSAAAATAMATGKKVNAGQVGVAPDGTKLTNLLELAAKSGKATGVVVTKSITDATPAAFLAHVGKRTSEEEIAAQMVKTAVCDVLIGGGKKFFSKRTDGIDLLAEAKKNKYHVALNQAEVLATPKGTRLLALLADNMMDEPAKRGDVLAQATLKALDLIGKTPHGFFLLVEGSKIDTESHVNRLDATLSEVHDFDVTVEAVLAWVAKNPDTLVVIAPDHETGGLLVFDGNIEQGTVKAKFHSVSHTGNMVPIFAAGKGAAPFGKLLDNTDVFKILRSYLDK